MQYIYCIIKGTEKRFGYTGINNQKVDLVRCRDIAAVVSNTRIINFDRLNKKDLTDYIAIHQKVNELLMRDYDVVPMAFGIIAPSNAEVQRILERAYFQFKTALKKVQGKAEFVIHVWWDKNIILEELIKLQDYIKDIHIFLNNVAYDSTLNRLLDKDMIANFSFLIEKAREPELDRKMQELGMKYEEKLRFKYIGPMPVYSFVNINLGLGNFELIDTARKLLGLPEQAAFEEIKKNYYGLSHKYHPDKFQGDGEQMKKISQAYSILKNYCQSCSKREKYSFQKKDVENSIIIK